MLKNNIEISTSLHRDRETEKIISEYENLLKKQLEFFERTKGQNGNTIVKDINDFFKNVSIKEYPQNLLKEFSCSLLGDLKERYQKFYENIKLLIEGRIVSKISKDSNLSILLSRDDRDEIAKECYFDPVEREVLKFQKAIEIINKHLKLYNLSDEWQLTIENCPGYTSTGDSLEKQIDMVINNKKERLQRDIEEFVSANPVIITNYEKTLSDEQRKIKEERIFGEKTKDSWELMERFWSEQFTVERWENKNESERTSLLKDNCDYTIQILVDNMAGLNKQEKIKLIKAIIDQHPSDIEFGIKDKLQDLLEDIKKEYHKEDLPD